MSGTYDDGMLRHTSVTGDVYIDRNLYVTFRTLIDVDLIRSLIKHKKTTTSTTLLYN